MGRKESLMGGRKLFKTKLNELGLQRTLTFMRNVLFLLSRTEICATFNSNDDFLFLQDVYFMKSNLPRVK